MRRAKATTAMLLFWGILGLGACSDPDAPPFELQIVPAQMQAIPGQRCVILVTLDATATEGDVPVNLSAATDDATVTVSGGVLVPGAVSEIEVIPRPGTEGSTLTVSIHGTRDGREKTETVEIEVVDGQDLLTGTAIETRDLFIPYLAQHEPALGINAQTDWIGTLVAPQVVVVAHYLFFSSEWELGVSWHVMIAPHDWAVIYLRHRHDQTVPTRAFRIESVSAPGDPVEIDPPAEVLR